MDPAVLYRHRVSRDGKRLDIFFSTFTWCLSRLSFIPTPICSLCQVLASRLRSAAGIVGVQLPNSAQELRMSGYADDTTVIISTYSSLAAVFEVCHEYELGSGAKLNRAKSKRDMARCMETSHRYPGRFRLCQTSARAWCSAQCLRLYCGDVGAESSEG